VHSQGMLLNPLKRTSIRAGQGRAQVDRLEAEVVAPPEEGVLVLVLISTVADALEQGQRRLTEVVGEEVVGIRGEAAPELVGGAEAEDIPGRQSDEDFQHDFFREDTGVFRGRRMRGLRHGRGHRLLGTSCASGAEWDAPAFRIRTSRDEWFSGSSTSS
jgi:hypothetical protein